MLKQTERQAHRWRIGGRVQGVGFRPFVARLATDFGLGGGVRNLGGEVLIEAEGEAQALLDFEQALLSQAPAIAQPVLLARENIALLHVPSFEIFSSQSTGDAEIHVTPDLALCEDCRQELMDPENRRHRYPFINCTQCGPRYTLIRAMPYDRANTAMDAFALCPACRGEYADPAQRRFHAEPIACPDCGPQLQFTSGETHCAGEAALQQCIAHLQAGKIIAVKGIGAYHLVCLAQEDTIAKLRTAKSRPHKPLAVMFRDLAGVRRELELNETAQDGLSSTAGPIVLLRQRHDGTLPQNIAPGLQEIGAMLPYSPLHALLLDGVAQPLVVTSANISGDPALTEAGEVEQQLANAVDGFLHHNREILRPAEDGVVRVIANQPRLLRLGRGHAPLELELPHSLTQPVLAVGAHMKNTVALAWGRRVVLSPHIGDLQSPRCMKLFEHTIADLQQLYGVQAAAIVCDRHPQYASSRWAAQQKLPLRQVWHHHAHASALALEHEADKTWLTFTWDGVGLGEDGTLWGGETLHGRPGQWRRVASLRPFKLPGGEHASREPWRAAAGVCWELGLRQEFPGRDSEMLHQAWQRGLNAPSTSAVGRLFDAAAHLLGLLDVASFEGQGPMLLEARAHGDVAPLPLSLTRNALGLWLVDWAPLIMAMQNTVMPPEQRAMQFHQSLAAMIVQQAKQLREAHAFDVIGLTGGVFQNKLLSELATLKLQEAGFVVHMPTFAPCNDGAIALGQVMECLQ